MGMFDDLIPSDQEQKSTGLFDDLIPEAPPATAPGVSLRPRARGFDAATEEEPTGPDTTEDAAPEYPTPSTPEEARTEMRAAMRSGDQARIDAARANLDRMFSEDGVVGFDPNTAPMPQREKTEVGDLTAVERAAVRGAIRTSGTAPALVARGAAQTIEQAESGFGSIGEREQRAAALDAEIAALEAELPRLQEADPDAAAGVRDEITSMRRRAESIRASATTSSAREYQAGLDEAAAEAEVVGADALRELRKISQRAAAIPMSASAINVQRRLEKSPDTVADTFAALFENPLETSAFLFEIAAESTPQIAASAAAGLITRNPALAATILGAGTFTQEYGSSVDEFLRERKVDLSTPEAAAAVLQDTELMAEADRRGLTRGIVIGAAETLGMGVSAKIARSGIGKFKKATLEVGQSAATGGGGEAAAMQLSGQEVSAREIILEAMAEVIQAPAEYGSAALSQDDVKSPIQDDVIKQGKQILAEIEAQKNAPSQPKAPGAPEGAEPLSTLYGKPDAAPNTTSPGEAISAPPEGVLPSVLPLTPENRVDALTGAPAQPQTPEQGEVIDVIGADGQPTGQKARWNPATNRMQIVAPEDLPSVDAATALPASPPEVQSTAPAAPVAPSASSTDATVEQPGEVSPVTVPRGKITPNTGDDRYLLTGGTLDNTPVKVTKVSADGLSIEMPDGQAYDIPRSEFDDGFFVITDENGEIGVFPDKKPTTIEDISDDVVVAVEESASFFGDFSNGMNLRLSPEEIRSVQDAGLEISDTGFAPEATIRTLVDERNRRADARFPKRSAPKPIKVQKKPFTNLIRKASGGIDPTSTLGQELAYRGINSRTAPGLFRNGGRKNLDNVPIEEFPELIGIIEGDGTELYFSEQAIIDALVNEAGGTPLAFGEQAEAQEAEARKAEYEELRERGLLPDDDGMESLSREEVEANEFIVPPRTENSDFAPEDRTALINGLVTSKLNQLGAALSPREIGRVVANLEENGGDVENAIWWQLEQEPEEYGTQERAGQDTGAAVAESEVPGARVGEGQGAVAGGAGRPAGNAQAETPGAAGSQPSGQVAGSTRGQGDQVTPEARLAQARETFEALDANKKIEDAQAYMAASTELSNAREAFADDLAAKGGRIELSDKNGLGVTITPTDGRFQISYFDDRGFSGDTVHDTLQAATRDAVSQGYDRPAPGLLKQKQKGEAWQSPAETQRVRDQVEGRATEPNASPDSPSGVDYPNRKLGFRYARSTEPQEGFGNIALANMKPGDKIRGYGEVTSITEKQIRIKGEDGKTKIFPVDSPRFEQLSRDVDGLVSASQQGVDTGDVLNALKRDPAFSYDERKIPQLSDTARGGKDGPKTSILKPLSPTTEPKKWTPQQEKGIKDINRALTPDNKDGDGWYNAGNIMVELDVEGADDSDILFSVEDARTRYKGRAKETKVKRNRFLLSEIGEGLSATAMKEVAAYREYWASIDADQSATTEQTDAADWWARASREDDGAEALRVMEQAGVPFSNRGRPWRDIRPADQEKLLAARNATPTTETTEAGTQTVIPGAEQDAERSQRAAEADQRREVEARAKQSKMGSTAPQAGAGPLFGDEGGTQTDMFAGGNSENSQTKQSAPATFPRPLSEVADTSAGRVHVYGEYGGQRFYVGTYENYQEGEAAARAKKARYADASFFLHDRADSTTINGTEDDLAQAIQSKADQAASPTPEAEVGQGVAAGQPAERIEDFGEKIAGAQKDKVKGWLARAEQVSDDEISSVPLSKSWPEPDYQSLIDEGADPEAVAFIHAARDEIPNKPRSGWKLKRWTEQVQTMRDFSVGLIDGTYTMAEVRAKADKKSLAGFMGRVDLYLRYGHEKSLKGVTLHSGQYSVFKGERFNPAKVIYTVELKHRMKAHGDTKEAAIEAFAPEYEKLGAKKERSDKITFEIRKWRSGNIFIGKKIGTDWIEVATDPEWDYRAARKYLAENQEALEAEFNRKKQLPPERGKDNSPRVGVDHRNGQDVTPEMFQDTFGFRGVQFGNYVEGPRRQQDLNEAYDGLMDLAGVIGVPPKALSLNGELGLAFGARGSGRKAAAHYEPGDIVINLTKGQGAGSLAHEWWHGMDHYFARQGGKQALLLTEGPTSVLNGDIRPEVKEQFDNLMKLIRLGKIKTRSMVADKRKSKPYFGTMVEMTARAFESYVIGKLQDQGAQNDYLANILSEDAWNALEKMAGNTAPSWPYVRASEMPEFREAFDTFFDTLKTEPSTRVNDKGETVDTVRLYQRPLEMFYSPLLRAVEGAKQKQAPAKDWKAILGKMPGVKQAEIEWLGVNEWLDAQEGQVTREQIADFVRESQIEVVEDRQTEDGPERDDLSDWDAVEYLGDDLIPDPDFRIETREAEYPEDSFFEEDAERYMDEAREELLDEEANYDLDGNEIPLDDVLVQERAEQIARDRWEPFEFPARLYNYEDDTQSGEPQEYDGYYDSDDNSYFFPDLSDDNLSEYEASRLAHEPIDLARQNQIDNKLAEMKAEMEARIAAENEGLDYTVTGQSRFDTYTEDGGTNYREILIRVPDLHQSGRNTPPGVRKNRTEYDRLKAEYSRRMAAAEQFDPGSSEYYDGIEDAEKFGAQMRNLRLSETYQEKSPFVESAHFEQENIVVHARVKDRVGPNGEKVLFVEEIQSDLATKWRENSESPEVTQRRRELEAEKKAAGDEASEVGMSLRERAEALLPELDVLPPYMSMSDVIAGVSSRTFQGSNNDAFEILSADPEFRSLSKDRQLKNAEFDRISRELIDLGTERRMDPSTPDTPFKEEHTYTLMVKRLLRMAAEEGYDRLSWTPGYMQAERWNNAAQSVVEGGNWLTDADGRRDVLLDMAQNGNRIGVKVDADGKIVSATQMKDQLVGKPLSSLLGPQLAQEVVGNEKGDFSGQKITFPDSGYAIAYDQQTKRAVDKLAKKHGAKVYVDKTLPDFTTADDANEARNAAIVDMGPQAYVDAVFDLAAKEGVRIVERVADDLRQKAARAQEMIDGGNNLRDLDTWSAVNGIRQLVGNDMTDGVTGWKAEGDPVWSIDITDDLRSAAMEPMAILRKGARLDEARVKALMPALRKRLNDLAIRNMDLRYEDMGDNQGATELYRNGDMAILIGASLNEMKTLNHEAIHALRWRGLFTAKEWAALEAEAKANWLTKYDIKDRYGDLDPEAQIEEAIAEAFADFAEGKAMQPKIKGVFAKIKRFFRALKETLAGAGITTAADVFERVESGAVGARAYRRQDPPMTRAAFQRPTSKVRKPTAENRAATAASTHSAHIPDRTVWAEMAAQGRSILDRASGTKGAIADNFDFVRTRIQDRNLVLQRAINAAAELNGQQVDAKQNPYLAEERFFGRVGHVQEQIKDQFIDPIAQKINEASFEVTDQNGETRTGDEAVALWLMARHAKERNAHIASINDQMPDGGSGLTNAEADAILQQGQGNADLDAIGQMTDALGNALIDLRERAGLLSAQDALAWRQMYQHYMPLQGFADEDMFDGIWNERGTNSGRRYNVRGQESLRAMGRGSEAFNPLVALFAQAQEVAIRAEKNKVAKTLYDFVALNPNPAMWEISTPETQRFFNAATGKVETRVVGAAARPLAENEMALKIDGKERRITFNDPRLARALGQLGTNDLSGFGKLMMPFSRLFSATNTMLSPPFWIVNFFRDFGFAQFSIQDIPEQYRSGVRKQITKDAATLKSMRAAFKGLNSDQTTAGALGANVTVPQGSSYAEYFKEFHAAGAKIHFFQMDDVQTAGKDFKKQLKRSGRRGLGKLKNALVPNTRDNPMLHFIERVNLAIDNSMRLSAYVAMREQGASKEEAATVAKNLTVNFNRRGDWSSEFNALYPFFNAAVQGSHKLLKVAKDSKKAQATLVGMFVTGMAMDLLNAAMSDEDDDGELEYDKIANYTSERNLILPSLRDDSYTTIPLAYGLNAFFYAGQQFGKVMRGVKKPGEAVSDVASATAASFLPISFDDPLQAVMPTVGDLGLQLYSNKDWLGRPIRPESPYGDYGPQSYKEYNASNASRMIARGLNVITLGTPIEAGLIDISPEYIDHTAKFFSGGLGRFLGRGANLAERAALGTFDMTELYEVPFLRVVQTNVGEYINQQRYFEFKEAVDAARFNTKEAEEMGYPIPPELRSLNSLWPARRQAEKARTNLKKKINEVRIDPTLTERQRELRVKALRRSQDQVYLDFNRKFIQVMGPQAE